jgi:GNAT superfamily N-acetyltransferase
VNATPAAAAPAVASIRPAIEDTDFALARGLFEEYAQWLGVDLCFQGFAEELKTLPGAYAPPLGCLLLAGSPGSAFACIALRPLPAGTSSFPGSMVGEVKRLYVQPARRGEGWGNRLAQAVIAHARASCYLELRLDTLEWMKAARSLYASLGFGECERYYDNPLSGVVYMRLVL